MNNKEKIDSMMNERLRRLISEFELDLIRLLKTASFLSLSKDVLQKHVNYIFSESTNLQKNLGNLTISLLKLEKKISEQFTPHGEKSPELVQDLKIYIDDLNLLINEHINHIKEATDVLEKKRNDDINNLEALNNLYNLELQAAQTELDNRLRGLKNIISQTINEVSSSEDKTIPTPTDSSSRKQEEHPPVIASDKPQKYSLRNHKIIILSIIFAIVGFFLGIMSLYFFDNRKLLTNPKISSGESFKDLESLIKFREESTIETKQGTQKTLTKGKIQKTDERKSTKNEKEETDSIPYQKILLTVTSPIANIRNGPGLKYSVISTAKGDERLEKLDQEQGIWLKIKKGDGTEGWISKKLVTEIDE